MKKNQKSKEQALEWEIKRHEKTMQEEREKMEKDKQQLNNLR
ncbi:MAG: hypothetical protein Dasosvirus4_25 [Dasosvirus sp.]|uniref:Uncharacterized protein n=1 Tax=Dasosvirus sp. TaxID=2487764 RepID=A0A3G4ZT56_9VIRU|nr:MAG: hypothetical protein Dasosvirus4_25 [Dasosvirus sp.]